MSAGATVISTSALSGAGAGALTKAVEVAPGGKAEAEAEVDTAGVLEGAGAEGDKVAVTDDSATELCAGGLEEETPLADGDVTSSCAEAAGEGLVMAGVDSLGVPAPGAASAFCCFFCLSASRLRLRSSRFCFSISPMTSTYCSFATGSPCDSSTTSTVQPRQFLPPFFPLSTSSRGISATGGTFFLLLVVPDSTEQAAVSKGRSADVDVMVEDETTTPTMGLRISKDNRSRLPLPCRYT